MRPTVIAIGLDAANPELLERWLDRGLLPHMQRLRADGAFGQLASRLRHHRAETPWPMFATGRLPTTTGNWGSLRYDPTTYQCVDPPLDEGAPDYVDHPLFYAGLGESFPVAVFDVPQVVVDEDVHGVQVLGWGAHSRRTPQRSQPAALYSELVRRYGENPLLDKDSITPSAKGDRRRFLDGLAQGISRKADIVCDLLARRRWSLLLTVFGESHSAQHSLWHESQPHTADPGEAAPANDPLLDAFRQMDHAIGRIREAAPTDATIVAFSVHGTRSNNFDLGANVFLPEMLYRWNFPGRCALGPGRPGRLPLARPRLATKRVWWNEFWNSRHEPNRLKAMARRHVPDRLFHRLHLERLTGKGAPSPLTYKPPVFWLAASWYAGLWPDMRAFALPSYSDGYVRLNVQGREGRGLVSPTDYSRVCDEVTHMLHSLRDTRQDRPLVEEVVRTRESPFDDGPEHSSADLVVLFHEDDHPADTVDSDQLGRIGPIPFYRTGGHYSAGFFLGAGPTIAAGTRVGGDVLDVPPTLLSLMGAPVRGTLDGRPLGLARPALPAAAVAPR